MKPQYVTYKRSSIKINQDTPIRTRVCGICGREGKTDLHHTKYIYSTKEVKKNPVLALDNTIELCYRCHRIMNAWRIVEESEFIILSWKYINKTF